MFTGFIEEQQQNFINSLLKTIEQQNSMLKIQNEQLTASLDSHAVTIFQTVPLTQLFQEWLDKRKAYLQHNTYHTYIGLLHKHILPYFSNTNLTIGNTSANDIEEFYNYKLLEGLSANSVIRLHSFVFSTFKYAENRDYIMHNPMNKVKRPKNVPFVPNVYDAEMIKQLFQSTRHLKIYPAIILAATLGLRRSEIAGLTWDSVNLTTGTITIRQKTIRANFEEHDIKQLKTKTSYRSLKLPLITLDFLKRLKTKQTTSLKKCKNQQLIKNYKYVLIDNEGHRITLERITGSFRDFIESHPESFMKIRFHDLRHSCACILLNNGCNMKQVQEWLGHSNFAFTAQVYIHLTAKEKEYAATRLDDALSLDFILAI